MKNLVAGFAGAARRMRMQPMRSALAVSAIFVVVLLFAVVAIAKLNLSVATARFSGGFDMVVYLDQRLDAKRGHEIGDALAALPAVKHVEFVSPERALERLQTELGESFSGLEASALPSSLEVSLMGGVRDVASTHPLVGKLQTTEGVAEVELLGDWVDRLSKVEDDARRGAYGLLLLVALVTVVVVFSATGQTPRSSGRLPALFGASPWFERLPRLFQGALIAAAGAVLALGVLRLLFPWGRELAQQLYESGTVTTQVSFFSTGQMFALVIGVAVLGTIGSALPREKSVRVF